ncbi:Uu.00g131190.m01.CDS01 [Anthostomella pinea]|uniref:Uu.00g131190.m01.CDS01 n=1 Tax=Anthostomella pinea TaxID=933095 RepID=A0AAI8VJS7_9PEZI|nr:Uu.00g131190.m01.CDS01 [Anthostomella pinea]
MAHLTQPNGEKKPPILDLPLELVQKIYEGLETPRDAINMACTCSAFAAAIKPRPLHLITLNARMHRERARRPVSEREALKLRQRSQPILHAIQKHDDLELIEKILDIYQLEFSVLIDNVWYPKIYHVPTPVEAAISAGRLEVVRLLVQKGCGLGLRKKAALKFDPRVKSLLAVDRSSNAFMYACLKKQQEIAIFLFQHRETEISGGHMYAATYLDNPDVVRVILQHPSYNGHNRSQLVEDCLRDAVKCNAVGSAEVLNTAGASGVEGRRLNMLEIAMKHENYP